MLLQTVSDTLASSGSAAALFFVFIFKGTTEKTKEIVLESVETTSEILTKSIDSTSNVLSQIAQYTGLASIYSLLVKIVELIAKVPELIVTIIKNAIVFFYIFCVLILVGQFDWLLDDIYTLTAISLLLTYLTYR